MKATYETILKLTGEVLSFDNLTKLGVRGAMSKLRAELAMRGWTLEAMNAEGARREAVAIN